jgi:uncharacterized OB-fold protein
MTTIAPRIGRWTVTAEGDVILNGTHCPQCDETVFPAHTICVRCANPDTHEALLRGPAMLRSFTIVHQLPPGFPSPLVVGYGEFEGRTQVLAPIVDVTPDQLIEGRPLALTVGVTRTGEDGEEFVTYQFTPVEPWEPDGTKSSRASGQENAHA